MSVIEDGSDMLTCKSLKLNLTDFQEKYVTMADRKNSGFVDKHYAQVTLELHKRALKEFLDKVSS